VIDDLDSAVLATALVGSLRAIVPSEGMVSLFVDGDAVRLEYAAGGNVVVELRAFGVSNRLTVSEATTAVAAVLSTLQDLVVENLTDPWPVDAAGSMALPHASVDEGWIVGRFGPASEPIVELQVMPVQSGS
jgi:hypothetical protein